MDSYRFPKRGELRGLITQVWPERGHKPLIELVLAFAELEVAPDGLPGYLALAIEGYCQDRSDGLRKACYATMPVLIRVLVVEQAQRNLALNEYCAIFDRLCRFEAKYFQAP